MAITIDKVRVQTFENNVVHLAQQQQAKLRGHVMIRNPQSTKHNWERIGLLEAAEKSSARTATPEGDAAWTRRTAVIKTWHAGDSVEEEDLHQMIVEPKSALQQALAKGMNRKIDDVIIDAADATTATLDGDGNTVAFGGATVGDGTTAISFDMVTEVQEQFMLNDIDLDVPKVFVIGPTQVRKLMQLTEQTSDDYVSKKLDQLSSSGIVPNWMGFTWVMSNRLNIPGGGELNCLAFTEQAIGLHITQDITTKIGEDPSKSFLWRVYCRMMMSAVRVDDDHIIKVHVLNSL
jgi:hypothetical protein